MKRVLTLNPVERCVFIGRRKFSGRPICFIKSNLLESENVIKSHKKEFKILTQLGLNITEKNEQEEDNDNINVDEFSNYNVGHFPNQYPMIAHQNISKFSQNLMSIYPINHFLCSKESKHKVCLPVTSTIDYYPFPITYSSKDHSSSSKKKNLKPIKPWKIDSDNQYKFQDSVDTSVPVLSRRINKNTKQQLVIFRDIHCNISSLSKMETFLKQYKPDKIILELTPDGASNCLPSFISWRYKYFVMPLLRIRGYLTRNKTASNVGYRWLKYIRRLICPLPASYASIIAINNSITDNIPIVCSDYSEKHIVSLLAFAETMDIYHSVFYEKLKLSIKKISYLKTLISSSSLLTRSFARICGYKLQPHLYIVAGYRNDIMSLAINECCEDKLLFIGGEGHCYDIIDRLCGDVLITNPFKEIDNDRVILKDFKPNYCGNSKFKIDNLTQEDIKTAQNVLGVDVTSLFLIPENKYDNIDQLKTAIDTTKSSITLTKAME